MLATATDYATMFGGVATEAGLAVAAAVTIGVGVWLLSFGPTKALGVIKRIAGRS